MDKIGKFEQREDMYKSIEKNIGFYKKYISEFVPASILNKELVEFCEENNIKNEYSEFILFVSQEEFNIVNISGEDFTTCLFNYFDTDTLYYFLEKLIQKGMLF